MSYDYDALVTNINLHRQAKKWQEAVDSFSTLSTYCPMTPLMWIQYAHDTSQLLLEVSKEDALDVRLDTLELGLAEFPGCALLQLHYVELLLELIPSKTDETYVTKVREGIENAIQAVGKGSHRNEDVLVIQIYNHYASFVAQHLPNEDAIAVFCQRARIPMLEANDAFRHDLDTFAGQHNLTVTTKHIEELENVRAQTASWFGSLVTCEDDIDEAMQKEQILARYTIDLKDIDWDKIILSTDVRCWMGLGGAATARAFQNYAQTCSRFPKHHQAEQVQWIQGLSTAVYERGVAECPTVESLWLLYLKTLSWVAQNSENRALAASSLQNVASRAVRNCPYSLTLAQYRLHVHGTLAEVGHSVFDPDSLVGMVEETIKAKFLTLPEGHLELYIAAIQAVKRRILLLLTRSFDEPSDGKDSLPLNLSDAEEEEIQDLVEDLREMYDTADKHFCKTQSPECRVVLWADRSKSETYFLTPLAATLQEDESTTINTTESMRCFEKLLTLQTRTASFRSYIQMLLSQPVSTPGQMARKFQRMRHTYQTAVNAMSSKPSADYEKESAKRNLCTEYVEFEKLFGSDKSYTTATRLVQKKYRDDKTHQMQAQPDTPPPLTNKGSRKRKQDSSIGEPVEAKKLKTEQSPTESNVLKDSALRVTKGDGGVVDVELTKAKEEPRVANQKVKVGNMEYPAHPFTIRVSNLAHETEDMDLVDTFRSRCGAIVHAKVIREKNQKGKGNSKGWGLVQFENHESVEIALALHDTIGLHEKVLQIERSHMPAALLVPPGHHRVRPKGQGKVSKRNQKKREQTGGGGRKAASSTVPTDAKEGTSSQKKPLSTELLALMPRGVARKAARKPKLELN